MWAICRINILGTEILAVEVGHQQSQPQLVDDQADTDDALTGGVTHNFDRRPVEDVRDTKGWLPNHNTHLGFTPRGEEL